eukprot:TRINITY_DN16962_c0_g1_i1.p1 TRINITY_DN16962_c0_g1~~TRINITY_DN16962_c0_g1_i1.p1  ORF type:complete len:349 (+),score=56.83 TRINITY_DN16962_c0_g1_i1:78-1049(+)
MPPRKRRRGSPDAVRHAVPPRRSRCFPCIAALREFHAELRLPARGSNPPGDVALSAHAAAARRGYCRQEQESRRRAAGLRAQIAALCPTAESGGAGSTAPVAARAGGAAVVDGQAGASSVSPPPSPVLAPGAAGVPVVFPEISAPPPASDAPSAAAAAGSPAGAAADADLHAWEPLEGSPAPGEGGGGPSEPADGAAQRGGFSPSRGLSPSGLSPSGVSEPAAAPDAGGESPRLCPSDAAAGSDGSGAVSPGCPPDRTAQAAPPSVPELPPQVAADAVALSAEEVEEDGDALRSPSRSPQCDSGLGSPSGPEPAEEGTGALFG